MHSDPQTPLLRSSSSEGTSHGDKWALTSSADRTLKILVVGDIGTGKTSIIRRYVHNLFSSHYQATIGVDFALKIMRWNDNLELKLQFWDIAGQERFSSMTRVYYRGASGAIVVFDVSRASSMDGAARWKEDLDAKCRIYGGLPIPCILLANKCDLLNTEMSLVSSDVDKFSTKYGFSGWFAASAKENIGISEAVTHLCNSIMTVDEASEYEVPVVQAMASFSLDTNDGQTIRRKNGKLHSCCN